MSKAYDRVEWNFLEVLFQKMGFDQKWISWIMTCVCLVTYTVLVNRQTYGHITPKRRIRQGDLLSSFIFILCVEALVYIMNKAEEEGRNRGMSFAPKCPKIQHLLFANDNLFACRTTFANCSEFLRCLWLSCDASGQEINFQKSPITFGANIDPITKRVIANLLGIGKKAAMKRT